MHFKTSKYRFIHTLKTGDEDGNYEFGCDVQGVSKDDPFMKRRIIFFLLLLGAIVKIKKDNHK